MLPKKDRYTLCVRIEQSMLEVLEFLLLAQTKDTSSKLLILNKSDLKVKMIQLFVRMAYEIKSIDQKKYILLEERLLEIGKMIGGWIRSVKSPSRHSL